MWASSMSKSSRITDLIVVFTFFPLNSPTWANLIATMGLFHAAHREDISCDMASKFPPQNITSMLYPHMS